MIFNIYIEQIFEITAGTCRKETCDKCILRKLDWLTDLLGGVACAQVDRTIECEVAQGHTLFFQSICVGEILSTDRMNSTKLCAEAPLTLYLPVFIVSQSSCLKFSRKMSKNQSKIFLTECFSLKSKRHL